MSTRRQPKLIGAAVRDFRMQLGLTQQAVAELADVAPETLSRVERNRLATSLDLTRRLAAALEVTVDDLLGPRRAAAAPTLRPAERRLLALVRRLDEAQVDDITRALRILFAVATTPVAPAARRGRSTLR